MDGYWADTDGSDGTYDGRIDWAYKTAYREIFDQYADLIALRKGLAGLRDSNINVFHENNSGKVVAWHRWDNGSGTDDVIVLANFSNTEYTAYDLGLPYEGRWVCLFHGDNIYYGSDFQQADGRPVLAGVPGMHGFSYHGTFRLSPYSLQIYVPEAAWSPVLPYGDLDGDGAVTAADLALMANGLSGSIALPTASRWLDLDENQAVEAADLNLLLLLLGDQVPALPWRG